MFFLNQDMAEDKSSKPTKKAPATKVAANGSSPAKHKTAGGKVLRNKTRSAAHDEMLHSTVAKITEHQRELHQKLQSEGLAKYSEGGGGLGGKEGKTWKRFQSYKGEAGLPREVESMRVSPLAGYLGLCLIRKPFRFLWIGRHKPSSFPFTGMQSLFISIRSKT